MTRIPLSLRMKSSVLHVFFNHLIWLRQFLCLDYELKHINVRKKCRDRIKKSTQQPSLRDCARSCPSFVQLFSYPRSCIDGGRGSAHGCKCECYFPNLIGDVNTCVQGSVESSDSNVYNYIDGKLHMYSIKDTTPRFETYTILKHIYLYCEFYEQ